MSAPDSRVMVACCDCGREFLALGEWQVRCRTCYARFKAAEAAGPDIAVLQAENARLRTELTAAMSERARLLRESFTLRLEVDILRLQLHAKQDTRRPGPIPREQWRRLLQLVHPDRHGGSPAATEATKWLLEVRP